MATLLISASPGGQRLLEYNDRRTDVLRRVNAKRYGTRADISRALGVSPATISAVLNGRIVDPKRLSDIEDWLDKS